MSSNYDSTSLAFQLFVIVRVHCYFVSTVYEVYKILPAIHSMVTLLFDLEGFFVACSICVKHIRRNYGLGKKKGQRR
jgi:hypothetical protein